LALDSAASEFYKNGKYNMQQKELSTSDMIKYYSDLCAKYPIYSIEDGLDEGDHQGWINLTKELGHKVTLVGDDLFVTNKEIFSAGIKTGEANAILIKVNQIGTLTETFEAMELGYAHDYKAIISHRSGETGDSFIADLAVATASGHIKTGSASRSDRMEKYNQLLRIEEELGAEAIYLPVK
jgi:enolase